ncbi:S8 family serine peptidase [Streptomyces sp. NBC_00247]|uniref:S8 family serine peptidase n=1 Tax=Streptomyces sp. NBC_00247 TaxID=2975689 RepID=UPI002E2A461A|nr:S8 family serine peptidase [Streptomyces sp. NBC_00247]
MLTVCLCLGTLLPLVSGAEASAADEAPVRLPVMPARLDADAVCTSASAQRATTVPWEQRSLQLTRTWPFSDGSGVTVAVVDTGVSTTASALSGRVTAVGSAGQDCVGHGSFVAGLVAAATVDGVRFAGVAQRARILAVRGTDERGAATARSVASGIAAATAAGADVITVSPALVQGSDGLTKAVEAALAKDVLVIAAAVPDRPAKSSGAQSSAQDEEPAPRDYWPASQPGVLSVLDVDAQGQRPDDALLPGSADLAAPGDGVVGIGARGNGHYIGSGASFAAAYVAGAAALVRSSHPGLTGAETAARLTASAYPDVVPRLDPFAAVTEVAPGNAPGAAAPAPGAAVRLPDDDAALPVRRATLFAAAGAALILLVAWAALTLPRARTRRWRPAGAPAADESGGAGT